MSSAFKQWDFSIDVMCFHFMCLFLEELHFVSSNHKLRTEVNQLIISLFWVWTLCCFASRISNAGVLICFPLQQIIPSPAALCVSARRPAGACVDAGRVLALEERVELLRLDTNSALRRAGDNGIQVAGS